MVGLVGVPDQPLMLLTRVFQEFLLNMDDNMDETESVKRYNQYKLDFRRQQLQDFFLQHKDQEWFRSKFHPDDMAAKRAESLAALKTRLRVFLFLLDNGWLEEVLLDMEHAPAIIKLMDAGRSEEPLPPRLLCPLLSVASSTAVIKMEGGTDFDLQVLEVPTAPGAAAGDLSRLAAAAGGEQSQDDRVGASRSAPTNSEAKGGQAEASGAPSRDRKDAQRVRVQTPPHASS